MQSLKYYDVFKDASGNVEAVKVGFSWPSFWGGAFWMYWKRMKGGALLFGIELALGLFVGIFVSKWLAYCVLFGISLLLGFMANKWQKEALIEKAFEHCTTVCAKSRNEALIRFETGEVVIEETLGRSAWSSKLLFFGQGLFWLTVQSVLLWIVFWKHSLDLRIPLLPGVVFIWLGVLGAAVIAAQKTGMADDFGGENTGFKVHFSIGYAGIMGLVGVLVDIWGVHYIFSHRTQVYDGGAIGLLLPLVGVPIYTFLFGFIFAFTLSLNPSKSASSGTILEHID